MPAIVFRCPGSNARIKAPAKLAGQRHLCPGCQTPLVVQHEPPEDSGPVLATDERPPARRPAFR